MNILYIYAHPHSESFNAGLKDHACAELKKAGHSLQFSDLYAMRFNAVASWEDFTAENQNTQYSLAQQEAFNHNTLVKDIQDETAKLHWADHIIMQFPLWWFSAPAIMKGWFDRVFVKGFAYDADKRFDTGLLSGKTVSLTVSTQSPEEAYQQAGIHGATIAQFLLPIHHTLRFVGIEDLEPFIVFNAFQLSPERELQIFEKYANYLTQLVTSSP